MKLSTILSVGLASAISATTALAASTFEVTVTNGGIMPISPGVLYVRQGGLAAATLGSTASSGFVQLCQAGQAQVRATELRGDAQVTSIVMVPGPILPGESSKVEISVAKANQVGVHFEAMYGKTKDTCAVASAPGHALVALESHVSPVFVARDEVLQSGAFQDPAIPGSGGGDDDGGGYGTKTFCDGAADAISCLRALAAPSVGPVRVRSFSPYLPNLTSALIARYGSDDVRTLNLSPAGSVQLQVRLKH